MNNTEESSKLLPPPSPLAFKEKIGKAKMFAFGTFALLFVAVAITANAQNHGTDATLLRNKETELKQSVTYTSKCLQPSSGPVLSGYDVVAYHSLDAGSDAVAGSSEFTETYGNHGNKYTFYFSSQKNLELFKKDPSRYLPANGGFCSWGIAEESWWTVDTMGPSVDPNVWELIDGKLYLFMFNTPKSKFMGELTDDDLDASGITSKYIADARKNWETFFEGEAAFNTNCFWWDATTDGRS